MTQYKHPDHDFPLAKNRLKAKATLNWWATDENKYPCRANVDIQPLINGEKAFAAVEDAILNATKTIDIISWGFDPAMRLTRPNGKRLGDLLIEKARDHKVEVRVLIWKNKIANFMENTIVGDGLSGRGGTAVGSGVIGSSGASNDNSAARSEMEHLWSERERLVVQYDRLLQQLQSSNDPQIQLQIDQHSKQLSDVENRLDLLSKGDYGNAVFGSGGTKHEADDDIYTRNWFRDIQNNNYPRLEFRTRDFKLQPSALYETTAFSIVNALYHRVRIFKRLSQNRSDSDSIFKILALSLAPSHHQKMVLTDYELKEKARGLVMGHNLHRNYWDTDAHNYYELRRDVGFGPWQDLSCEVNGSVLWDLNENFCTAWDHQSSLWVKCFEESLSEKRASVKPIDLQVAQNKGMAQIVRTHPTDGKPGKGEELSILEAYLRAMGNAADFIFMENQYFRYKPFAAKLKERALQLQEAGAEKDLYWFVITNKPAKGLFSSSTYEMLYEVGQEQLMPQVQRDRVFILKEKQEELQKLQAPQTGFQVPYFSELLRDHKINDLKSEITKLEDEIRLDEADQKRLEAYEDEVNRMEVLDEKVADGKTLDQAEAQELKQLQDKHGYDKIDPELFEQEGLKTVVTSLVSYTQNHDKTCRYRDIYIHSKLLVVDDEYFLLSSANINQRSMESDTELGIHGPRPKVAREFTDQLWNLHTQFKSNDTTENYDYWFKTAKINLGLEYKGEPLLCSLTRFWDTATPWAEAVD
ncbi:phospholipase D-like domain-containing protein [Neptuniibacter sp. QD34_54]|uniref:phospholipase D-like domain-containing protein n=1 Tax=Neptuniibacter sp. QD34_54 TaxID=3398208 RepID=UPI0039F533DF